MKQQDFCPCCGRHCDLDMPMCERGAEYRRTGTVAAEPHDGHYGRERRFKDDRLKHDRLKHDQETDLLQKLIINLRGINHVMQFLYEGRGSQKRILIILNEAGKITQRELTERLGIQPGSASEVIAKLEDAGSIVRVPSELDRRTMDIVLTEQGRNLAETAAAQRKQRHEEMFSCLSGEERRLLLELLEKINGDWEIRYQETGREHRHGGRHHRGHGHDGRQER